VGCHSFVFIVAYHFTTPADGPPVFIALNRHFRTQHLLLATEKYSPRQERGSKPKPTFIAS